MATNATTNKPIAEDAMTATAVRDLIVTRYADALGAAGVAPDEAPDDLDLREAGVIDSLGFLELVVELEQTLGRELDFESLDPDLLTTLGPLSAYVAAQAAAAPAA